MKIFQRQMILLTLGIFFFMVIVDGSIVTIAIPQISRGLNIYTANANLIISVYLVTISALLLPFGQIGNIVGRNMLFKIGTIFFVVGSAMSGFSPSFPLLLISRFIQAIGAGTTMSTSYAIITDIFPSQELGRALGFESIFISLGALAGPGLGGLILSHFSWHYIFLINLPIGLLCIAIEVIVFPKSPKSKNTSFDIFGTLLLIGMAVIFYILSEVVLISSTLALILFSTFVLIFILFVLYERRLQYPLVDVTLFNNLNFRRLISVAFISFVVSYFFSLLAPIYLQLVQHFTIHTAGLLLMISPIASIIFNPIAGTMVDRYNKNSIMVIGLLSLLLSQVGLVLTNGQAEPLIFIIISVLMAIGTALFGTANNTLIMQSFGTNVRGMVGSINSLGREFGLIVGTTLATYTYYTKLSVLNGYHVNTALHQDPKSLIASQSTAYLLGLGLLLFSLFILLPIKGGESAQHEKLERT